MTQNTQTTKIEEDVRRKLSRALDSDDAVLIITGYINDLKHQEGEAAKMMVAQHAAEIVALTAERDKATVIAEARHRELIQMWKERDEARAEVAKLKEQNRVLATTSLRDVIKSFHPSGRARGQ